MPALKREDMPEDVLIRMLRETRRRLTGASACRYNIFGDKYGVDEADFESLDVRIK